MHQKVHASASRLGFLDWLRGLGAVIMLQGHVFHSFTGKPYRDGAVFQISQFFGGLPPAIFLFLTGITFAFLLDSAEKKGLPSIERWSAALWRAGYLFLLAYAFRLQLWLFGWPASPWTDLLKVDILNCMGLGLALFSALALFGTRDRARLGFALGVGVAAASPLASQFDWSGTPAIVRMYLMPDINYFSFFPWASFLAFGVGVGSLMRIVKEEFLEKMVQWAALAGFTLILGAQYFSNLPYTLYSKSDFWLDGPGLVLIKLGVILLMLAFAFVWERNVVAGEWSWVRQMGTTSLLVYWAHIELVYGRWLWRWKENLTVPQTWLLTAAVVALMLALSVARTSAKRMLAGIKLPGKAAVVVGEPVGTPGD